MTVGRLTERIGTALEAPVKAQYVSGLALFIAALALGIALTALVKGGYNAR